MSSWTSNVAVIAAWCATAARPVAGLNMPASMSTNMVLPREPLTARLWGSDEGVGETISVKLDGTAVGNADVDAEGNWMFEFYPQAASSGKRIQVTSTTGAEVVFDNVAFGDVYLCSGQSNMALAVNAVKNATEEIADSVHYPDLRFFQPERNLQLDSVSKPSDWMVSKPSMFIPPPDLPVSHLRFFEHATSATCYFFARDLYKALGGDVPIGFVVGTWCNMPIQEFSSLDALADATCGGTRESHSIQLNDSNNLKASQYESDDGMTVMRPGQIWSSLIFPLVKMRFSGVVWYQGESNSDDPDGYECLFPAMIADWRRKFELPDLEFYFVQVSTGYLSPGKAIMPEIRQAQLSGLSLKNTVAVPSFDLGEPNLGLLGSVHPRRKQEVGRRLALAVQKFHYGLEVVGTGPKYESFVQDWDSGELSIIFTSDTAEGLHTAGTPDCTACCHECPFEVRTTNGTWMKTQWHGAPVSGNRVTFTTATGPVGTLEAVRYAYAAWPQCGLYNGAGGPDDHAGIVALPFVQEVGRGISKLLAQVSQHHDFLQARAPTQHVISAGAPDAEAKQNKVPQWSRAPLSRPSVTRWPSRRTHVQ